MRTGTPRRKSSVGRATSPKGRPPRSEPRFGAASPLRTNFVFTSLREMRGTCFRRCHAEADIWYLSAPDISNLLRGVSRFETTLLNLHTDSLFYSTETSLQEDRTCQAGVESPTTPGDRTSSGTHPSHIQQKLSRLLRDSRDKYTLGEG
jgi:hypothetical protein